MQLSFECDIKYDIRFKISLHECFTVILHKNKK